MSSSKLALFTVIVSPLERQSPRCAIEGTREAKLLTIWSAESRDIPTRYDELDEGRLKSLVQALRGRAGQYKDERECIRYTWRNRRRMRYPRFHQQAFCTSTDVVEVGCNRVIGARLKRAGMHWTVKAANALIPCAAAKSADALRISGNTAQSECRWPHDLYHKSDVAPGGSAALLLAHVQAI